MDLALQTGLSIYPQSVIEQDETTYFLGRNTDDQAKLLVIEGDDASTLR